jgi:hypothetical protein
MRPLILAAAVASLLCAATAASTAQSLTPMQRAGGTPSDTKGFKLLVGNPYPGRMTFRVSAMDAEFVREVEGAMVKPSILTLAPGKARSIIVAFRIDPAIKERTIGVCIQPENFDGPILPRVCGRYTGRMR